jgi:hypothetical protein
LGNPTPLFVNIVGLSLLVLAGALVLAEGLVSALARVLAVVLGLVLVLVWGLVQGLVLGWDLDLLGFHRAHTRGLLIPES